MRVSYCDICHNVLKVGKRKIVLGVLTTEQPNADNNEEELRDVMSKGLQYSYQGIKTYEICLECEKVLDRFFHIRKEELTKINKEIEKIYKKKMGDK